MTTHVLPRTRAVRNNQVVCRPDEAMDAAARMFAEHGYHGTSLEEIADLLGIRKTILVSQFPSKEMALECVCIWATDGIVEGTEGVAESADAPLVKLTRLIAAHLAPVATRRDYIKVFINERQYLPGVAKRRLRRKVRRIERCFEEVIRAGIADGSVRGDVDARLAMLAVLGMCNAVINWRAQDQGKGMDRIAKGIARLIAKGLADMEPA